MTVVDVHSSLRICAGAARARPDIRGMIVTAGDGFKFIKFEKSPDFCGFAEDGEVM